METSKSDISRSLSKLEDQLKLWSAKITELKAKAVVKGQEGKIESRKQLDALTEKLNAAQSKLDEVKAAGADKWEISKRGVEDLWGDIERTIKKLVD